MGALSQVVKYQPKSVECCSVFFLFLQAKRISSKECRRRDILPLIQCVSQNRKKKKIFELIIIMQLSENNNFFFFLSARRSYGVFFTLDLDLFSAGVRLRIVVFFSSSSFFVIVFTFYFAIKYPFSQHTPINTNNNNNNEWREIKTLKKNKKNLEKLNCRRSM